MEMYVENINPEFLIALVESRPALWDKSSKSKPSQRGAAWEDICRVLNPDFNTFTRAQQNDTVRFIYKKWASIRDGWKKRKNYKYKAQLKFLEKNLKYKRKSSSKITGSGQSGSQSVTLSLSSDTDCDSSKNSDNIQEEEDKRGNKEFTQEENKVNMLQFMDIKPIDENNPHILFIKGLVPILNKLGVDEVLEFQMGVIRLLQDIRRRSMSVNKISVQRCEVPSSSFDLPHFKQDQE